MRIAVLASEGAPYAKSGGLGDVMEALPAALARIAGNEVVLVLPYYNKIKTNPKYKVEQVRPLEETAIVNRARYRARSLPVAGALLKEEDRGEKQMSLLPED